MTAIDQRAWLVKQGLAKDGRGRFSGAAKAALAEARKNGIEFIDKVAVKQAEKIVRDEAKADEPPKESVNIYAPHPPAHRTFPYYIFTGPNGESLDVAVAEACIKCEYSLGWCHCDVPQIRSWNTREVLSFSGAKV